MEKSRANQNNTLFSKRMYAIKKDGTFDRFPGFFGVSKAKFSRFLSGEGSPTLDELREFVLNYAADNQQRMIDLNWLMNDHDRRPGPVFVGEDAFLVATLPPAKTIAALPTPNAMRLRDYDSVEREPAFYRVVGEAAAFEGGGAMAGSFGDDDRSIWDDIEIPGTTHFVRVKGESMSPVILGEQYAMVGPEYLRYETPPDEAIVVAEVISRVDEQAGSDAPWEGVYVKRIKDGESCWWFSSVNPAFPTFSIHKNNCRLWPVIGVYFAGKGRLLEG